MWQLPITVTPAAAEPILLADAKEYLRIDAGDTGFDSELAVHISSARERAEVTTGTRLITQVVEVRADSFADLAHLPIGPVQTLDEIRYLDSAGAEQLLDPLLYELQGAELNRAVAPAIGTSWPSAYVRAGAVRVVLTVGYGDDGAAVPPAIMIAMLREIRAVFDDTSFDIEPLLRSFRIWA